MLLSPYVEQIQYLITNKIKVAWIKPMTMRPVRADVPQTDTIHVGMIVDELLHRLEIAYKIRDDMHKDFCEFIKHRGEYTFRSNPDMQKFMEELEAKYNLPFPEFYPKEKKNEKQIDPR